MLKVVLLSTAVTIALVASLVLYTVCPTAVEGNDAPESTNLFEVVLVAAPVK